LSEIFRPEETVAVAAGAVRSSPRLLVVGVVNLRKTSAETALVSSVDSLIE